MNKKTAELLAELAHAPKLEDYLVGNTESMTTIGLKDYLAQLLCQRTLTKAEVIAQSGLHQIYAYQIFSGRKRPSRNKLLALCFAMALTLDEVQRLLTIADVGILYPRVKRDSILIFALHKKLDVITCNELLFEQNEPILQ